MPSMTDNSAVDPTRTDEGKRTRTPPTFDAERARVCEAPQGCLLHGKELLSTLAGMGEASDSAITGGKRKHESKEEKLQKVRLISIYVRLWLK